MAQLFTFINTVDSQVITDILGKWQPLRLVRPLDVLMTYSEFSFDGETYEIQGLDCYIGEEALPSLLSDLPEESLCFLTALVSGFPVGLNI